MQYVEFIFNPLLSRNILPKYKLWIDPTVVVDSQDIMSKSVATGVRQRIQQARDNGLHGQVIVDSQEMH